MRFRFIVVLTVAISAAALLGPLAPGKIAAASDTISALISNPARFDGQHVVVTGVVRGVRLKTSRRGNPYETFYLCDRVCVHVFTFGQPALSDGQRLTVQGMFSADKHVGSYDFRNEIEADEGSLR